MPAFKGPPGAFSLAPEGSADAMTVRTYQVTIGERTLSVRLRRDDGHLFVRVGEGEERAIELSTVRNTLRCIALGPARTEVLAERTKDGVLVVVNGLQYQAEVQDEARARLARVASAGRARHARRELRAPMPGLVVKVLCQVGDSIPAGQPAIVLQAMKMENELSLPHDGVVAAVSVQPNQTVEQGQVLMVLE